MGSRVGRAMPQDQLTCSVHWPGDFGHTGAEPQASTAVEAVLLTCCEVEGHSSHELGGDAGSVSEGRRWLVRREIGFVSCPGLAK